MEHTGIGGPLRIAIGGAGLDQADRLLVAQAAAQGLVEINERETDATLAIVRVQVVDDTGLISRSDPWAGEAPVRVRGMRAQVPVEVVGLEAVLTLEAEADARLADFLRRIVEWVTGRSFSDLLRGVYAAYPEFAVNSVFRGR